MFHAIRDPLGNIVSLHREPVAGSESLAIDHPAVQAFLRGDGERGFATMDADLVRVLEGLGPEQSGGFFDWQGKVIPW